MTGAARGEGCGRDLAYARIRRDQIKAELREGLGGRLLDLTPERAVAIQEALGADVAMCLDHCPALPAAKGSSVWIEYEASS